MPPRPKSLTQRPWRAIALSVLLHAAIVAAAVFSWFTWKHRAPEEVTLAVEGTLVDERALPGFSDTPAPVPPPSEPTPPAPVPEPAPVEEQGPPKPDPAEIERKKEEERTAAEKVEQEKLEQARRAEDKKAEDLKEREDAERRETEKQAAAKTAAAKAGAEKAAAEKAAADRKAAEQKRADDAAAAKKAADEKARAAREAELRRSVEEEERGNALRNSDAMNRWLAQITAKIERAWIKPPSAQPGISCIVSVTQVPGGEVTSVRVDSCTVNDSALRESVERAVYNASPLPMPPDPALFDRSLIITFEPK